MNRAFITLLLCTVPFPATLLADDFSPSNNQIINHIPCKQLQINQKNGDHHLFCMSKVDQKTRKTDKTPMTAKQYSLFSSDNLTTNHHGATGNIGFAVIEYRPSDKQTLIHKEALNIPLGSFGKAPTEFSFHQIGINNFGYILQTTSHYQGIESGGVQIIGENNGQIFYQYIPTFSDDFGAHGDEKIAKTITYTINIQDQEPVTNIFPLKIILNGKYEGVEYHQQEFLLYFDEAQQQYIKPDNYPALL